MKTSEIVLKIKNVKEQLDLEIDAHLCKRGWHHMLASAPEYIWLWEKTLSNGKTLIVSRDVALSIQSSIAEQSIEAAGLTAGTASADNYEAGYLAGLKAGRGRGFQDERGY